MTTMAPIATMAVGIDLSEYEVGTLFRYADSREWCRDGQAEIIEAFGQRWLVDTYWRDIEHTLTVDQAKVAKVTFIPSQHRQVSAGDAEVYGEDKVIRITRQASSYVSFYVRAEEPALTELDHYRHLLRAEEERLAEHERGVDASKRSIQCYRDHIVKLEEAA